MPSDRTAHIQRLMRPLTISLFIILLSFFIMLNASSRVNEEKRQAVFRSIQKSFGGTFDSDLDSEGTYSLPLMDTEKPVDFSEISEYSRTNKSPVNFIYDKNKSIIRIPANLLFDFRGTELKQTEENLLPDVANLIRKYKYPIDITVHSDNEPLADTQISNFTQSTLRSLSVLSYFTEEEKIPSDRLMVYGWGEFRPAYSNLTAETRDMNRRVDIAFVHKGKREKPGNIFIFRNFFFKIFE